jgi:hypothetical protein
LPQPDGVDELAVSIEKPLARVVVSGPVVAALDAAAFTATLDSPPEVGDYLIVWQGEAFEAVLPLTVVSAQRALASVEDLRGYLRTGNTTSSFVPGSRESDDAFLELLLVAATRRAERHAQREFLPDPAGSADPAAERVIRAHGRELVAVPDVREVVTLTVDGQAVAAGSYDLTGRRDEPATLLHLPRPAERIVITGRFGFAEPPEDVRLAVLAMAARAFHDAQARLGDRVVDPDGGVTSYFRQLPVEAKAVLDSYQPPRPIPIF